MRDKVVGKVEYAADFISEHGLVTESLRGPGAGDGTHHVCSL